MLQYLLTPVEATTFILITSSWVAAAIILTITFICIGNTFLIWACEANSLTFWYGRILVHIPSMNSREICPELSYWCLSRISSHSQANLTRMQCQTILVPFLSWNGLEARTAVQWFVHLHLSCKGPVNLTTTVYPLILYSDFHEKISTTRNGNYRRSCYCSVCCSPNPTRTPTLGVILGFTFLTPLTGPY